MALGFDVNIISPFGIGMRLFDPRESTDTGSDRQEMTVIPVRTVAQGIRLMLGSKLCEAATSRGSSWGGKTK